MIASSSPPIVASSTFTTVLSGRRSSVINLYGLLTRIASATPAMFSKRAGSTAPWLPVMPIAVRVAPGMTCGRYPRCSISFTTAATSCSAAPAFITISMARLSYTRLVVQPFFRRRDVCAVRITDRGYLFPIEFILLRRCRNKVRQLVRTPNDISFIEDAFGQPPKEPRHAVFQNISAQGEQRRRWIQIAPERDHVV